MRPLRLRPQFHRLGLRNLSATTRRPLNNRQFLSRPQHNNNEWAGRLTVEPVVKTAYRLKVLAPERPLWLTFKTALRYATIFLVTFSIFVYLAEPTTDDNESKDGGAHGDKSESPEVVDDEDDEDGEDEPEGIFIPYWYPEQAPLEFYKATDPEYQEFLKFNKNDKRQAYVIHWLIRSIRRFSEINYEEFLGDVDVNAGRFWTDIVYPDGPPPEMYQEGILLASDGIYITQRPAKQRDVNRVSGLFNSILSAPQRLWDMMILYWERDRMMGKTGVPGVGPGNTSKLSDPSQSGEEAAGDGGNKNPADQRRTLSIPNSNSRLNSAQQAAIDEQKIRKLWNEGMAKKVENGHILVHALHRPFPNYIPRGMIAINGLAEAVGTKGRLTVNFACVFDPRTNGIVSVAIGFGPVRPHNQWPKGGW